MPRWTKKGRPKLPAAGDSARPKAAKEAAVKTGWTGLFRERRRDTRLVEENQVTIELLTDGRTTPEKTSQNALTRDISPGGVRLVTNTLLPVETLLTMEIVLARLNRAVRAMGVVRWTRSVSGEEMFESGIEFTQISPEDKMLLLEHTYKKKG
jgi:c-di-GMP-binding flagellar brake protein YcgR